MMKESLWSNYCQTLKPISCGMVDQEVILKVRFKWKTFEIFPRKDFLYLSRSFVKDIGLTKYVLPYPTSN